MTAKYYVDAQGKYLGGYDGAEPPAGAIEVPSAPASATDTWSGAQWVALEPVPESVAMWQARTVLIEEDLIDDVLAVLNAIPDEKARKLAQAKFEYSNTVRRDDPLVTLVIPGLGKSEAQIDAMFIRANKL